MSAGGEVLIVIAPVTGGVPMPEVCFEGHYKVWYYVARKMVEAVEEVRKSDKEAVCREKESHLN